MPKPVMAQLKTKVEDLEWIVRLKRPWHSRVECEGGGVYIGGG